MLAAIGGGHVLCTVTLSLSVISSFKRRGMEGDFLVSNGRVSHVSYMLLGLFPQERHDSVLACLALAGGLLLLLLAFW